MSLESYIRMYQELLTMVDPSNPYSVEHAVNILREILFLAQQSHMANPLTIRSMYNGIQEFASIARHRADFAGKPGDFHGNQTKRQRLMQMLGPHC